MVGGLVAASHTVVSRYLHLYGLGMAWGLFFCIYQGVESGISQKKVSMREMCGTASCALIACLTVSYMYKVMMVLPQCSISKGKTAPTTNPNSASLCPWCWLNIHDLRRGIDPDPLPPRL